MASEIQKPGVIEDRVVQEVRSLFRLAAKGATSLREAIEARSGGEAVLRELLEIRGKLDELERRIARLEIEASAPGEKAAISELSARVGALEILSQRKAKP
jgi:BMFP domain-containing protein YqiC